jgi:putative Mn2+ efflux pump MntP
MTGLFSLYLVAAAISLDTFAASVALGTRARVGEWLRIAGVFAVSGGIFPLAGMWVGFLASAVLAQVAQLLGALVLAGLGLWFLVTAWASSDHPPGHLPGILSPTQAEPAGPASGDEGRMPLGRLVLLSFGLSSDNLLVGLGLGLQGGTTLVLGLLTGASVFGATLTGLWLGRLKVSWFGRGAEALAGAVLLGLALVFLLGGDPG